MYTAIFPPIQVRGKWLERGGMAMGGTWLYNTGTANTRFAITDNRGYLVSLSATTRVGIFQVRLAEQITL